MFVYNHKIVNQENVKYLLFERIQILIDKRMKNTQLEQDKQAWWN